MFELQFNLRPASQSPNQNTATGGQINTQPSSQGIAVTPNSNTNDSIVSSQGGISNTSGLGNSGPPGNNMPQASQSSRDMSTAGICKIGQETVQDIISRTQEIFTNLKMIQVI